MESDLDIDLDWMADLEDIGGTEELLESGLDSLPAAPLSATPEATRSPTSYTSEKISIRINKALLERIKAQATELGRPYQTHINSLLTAAVTASAGR